MCGIFGYTNFNKNELNQARKALHTLTHRGPDQWGDWFDESVYLGHRRLSILDLSENGKQPMMNKDNTVVITVNGEIYNYKHIRNELKFEYLFKSDSDSEVILYGYQKWGIEKLLEKIDGMYSITIYDKSKRKLFLIRDRVGIKPLYYSSIDNQIIWGSELKAIIHFVDKTNLTIDYTALYDFLTYLYIPSPKTMYNDIFKLEPAHYATYNLDSRELVVKKYWELEVRENHIELEKAKEKLKYLIDKSVKEQMMSDVSLGFFLSGGMDSSAVVSTAKTLSNNVSAYSIGFGVKGHDETEYAALLAENIQINHNIRILSENKTKSMLSKLIDWYDEPFADTSAFPTNMVAEYAKESVTVVLTGDGGDEVFGGYNWYNRFIKLLQIDLSQWNSFRPSINNIENIFTKNIIGRFLRRLDLRMMNDLEKYSMLMGNMKNNYKEKYKIEWEIENDYDDLWYFRKYYRPDLPFFTRLQYLDFHTYLPDDILTKVDRATMAVSLEARVPLLSKEIIEFSFSLPESIRYHNGELKGLFKYTFADVLPEKIIKRRKKGFSIPAKAWKHNLYDGYRYRQEYILDLFIN